MATRKGSHRIEVKCPRGIVALVRYGTERFASYRVSYKYGADYWCEYVAPTRGNGARALRAFKGMVRFYRRPVGWRQPNGTYA